MLGTVAFAARAQERPSADATPQAIPGVVPERFRLPALPTPTPVPSPMMVPGPGSDGDRNAGMIVQPVLVPLATPVARERPAHLPKPRPSPTSGPSSAAVPAVRAVPSATPLRPTATTATTSAAPVRMPGTTTPGARLLGSWLWLALPALGAAAFAIARTSRGRRLPAQPDADQSASPSGALPGPPVAGPLLPPPNRDGDPFRVRVHAAIVGLADAMVTFDLEVELVNTQPTRAEGLRVALALVSANPNQDRQLAAFHAGPPPQNMADPMDMLPAAQLRMPVRLALRRDQLHVIVVGGRPMFVALLLCDLRWRGGLSVHHLSADFLIGTAGQGARPGPIWLDRPAPRALAAIAYTHGAHEREPI